MVILVTKDVLVAKEYIECGPSTRGRNKVVPRVSCPQNLVRAHKA